MQCVDKEILEILRSDCVATQNAGFKPYILLAKFSDVATWCKFVGNTGIDYSVNEKKVLTKDNIVLAVGKTWKKIESEELGMIKVGFKKNGNAFTTELKQRMQNSIETRGWIKDVSGARLVALVYETEGTLPLLFGHSDGYFLQVKKDGAEGEFGEKYADDKFMDVSYEYMPLLPFNYAGVVNAAAAV